MQEKFQERMTDFSGRKLSLQESQLDIRRTWNGGKGKDLGADTDMGMGEVGGTGVLVGVGLGLGGGIETGGVGDNLGTGSGEIGLGSGSADGKTEIGLDGAGVRVDAIGDMIFTSPYHSYSNHNIDSKCSVVEFDICDTQLPQISDKSPPPLSSALYNTATATNAASATAGTAASNLVTGDTVGRKGSADSSSSSSSSNAPSSSSFALEATVKRSLNASTASGSAGEGILSSFHSHSIKPFENAPSSSSSSSSSASPSAGNDFNTSGSIGLHDGGGEYSVQSPYVTVHADTKKVPSVFPYPVIPSHVSASVESNSSSSNSINSSSSSNNSSSSSSPSLPD